MRSLVDSVLVRPTVPLRRLVVPLLVNLVVLVTIVVPGAPRSRADSASPGRELVGALAVLRGWDARRLSAWRAADPVALGSLYGRGSRAGAADVRLLHAYDDHGLVVRRLWTQVFAVRVLRRTPGAWRLRVFDRVAGGVAERAGTPVALPSTRPTTRLVELRRDRGRWVVVETWA